MKRSPSHYTTTPILSNRDKIPPKSRSLFVHSVKLCITVVKVDIKVINASLSQNQLLQCAMLALMHAEIPRPCDATELNNDGIIKSGDINYQTELNLSIFSQSDLINDDSSLHSQILLTSGLQCNIFPFGMLTK